MRIGNYAAQFIEGVVQIVHPTSLPGVDVQPYGFSLTVLLLATCSRRRLMMGRCTEMAFIEFRLVVVQTVYTRGLPFSTTRWTVFVGKRC